MTDRIKRLVVRDFRGATQPLDLSFDAGKPVALIFGENGTGKSTIVDAIECVGNGSATFQHNWKLGKGKRKETYIPTIGKSLADVNIDLEFGSQIYKATLNAKGFKPCNTSDRPDIKVLRRKSLQAFIDANQAERYKKVAGFLDISQVEASELSLRQAYTETSNKFESASRDNAQALESLQGLWEAEGSPGLEKNQGAEAWARSQANTPIDTLKIKLSNLKNGVKQVENLVSGVQKHTRAKGQINQAEADLKLAEERLTTLEADDAQNNAQLVTLLQDARTYLDKTPDTLCPVCEQTEIDPDNLIRRLDRRIERMDSLKQANASRLRAQKNQQAEQRVLKEAEEDLLEHAGAAQLHFARDFPQLESIENLRGAKREQAVQVALTLHNELAAAARLDNLKIQLENTRKQYHTLTGIKQSVQRLDEKSAEAKKAEALQKKLGMVVEIFEAERKAYVDGILLDIAQEVDTLYQKIHPQENIGQLKLKLDERESGSLIHEVAFGERQDIPPQPYYSESHLDTLGLCIFLALAKRSGTGRTVVVLDDVLGSVDQQHLDRTLDMLLEAADNFAQIIITTHYRPLRDRFRYAYNQSARVQQLELKPWNFDQGIRTGETLVYAKELRQQLEKDDFHRDVIASQAGQLFENLLEFISQTYRCQVPHKTETRFTFGELKDAPNKVLKRALKVERKNGEPTETKLAPIYEKLGQALQVRNLVGCHFNQLAGELSDQDIRKMAELALELADALICPYCGSLPGKKKSGSYLECGCGKTHMHPMQQPA